MQESGNGKTAGRDWSSGDWWDAAREMASRCALWRLLDPLRGCIHAAKPREQAQPARAGALLVSASMCLSASIPLHHIQVGDVVA